MITDSANATLLRPQDSVPTAAPGTRGLSTEIQTQSARRLRALALLYAFTFFMASLLPRLVSHFDRERMFSNPIFWVPDTTSIVVAVIVAVATFSKRLPLSLVMNLGLVFLVTSNFGIAIAEFIDPYRLDHNGWMGLSWVAVWTPLYMVAVPTPSRKAVPAMIASVSSVPLMITFMIVSGRTMFAPAGLQFFFAVVFPYVLVAILTYVGACIVYDLGKEVTRVRELGSYRLVERLGQGGMGEVWRADHRLLARPAAIKLIRPELAGRGEDGSDAMRRFEREAQVTAQLRSPHTVELWDFGIATDGSFYYVMELLDGLDLDVLVTRHGPVSAERAIYLLRQVCHSLAEAESKGLVHRDIKPSNIFVCRYGGDYDFVKVLDFGIVKATGERSMTGRTMATGNLLLQGTPVFIAPEQALGETAIDGRADIYAAGCVAYWLLTGELVFTANTTMGVLMHHAHTAPVPPSTRSELPIPPALDSLVMSCLAKVPAERPQTANELSQRLAAIAGPAAWTDDQARDWWGVHQPEVSA